MIGTALKDAFHMLQGNWLRIIGIVILSYIIKFFLETLPIQGSSSIRFDPLSVATSDSLQTLFLAAIVNSILFFIMINYIENTQHTMAKRFVKACTFPFRHPKLLYKGLIVLFLINLLLYFIGLLVIYTGIGALIILSAGLNIGTGIMIFVFLLLYILLFWLFLGFSQTLYVLHDNPEIGTFRSIKRSFSLMKGHRWALFGLFALTGVGLILGLFLFLVGAVFSLILYEVTRLTFYRELLRKQRQKEWKAKVNAV